MSQIGRNDPCPCGSGKKYKKCCLGQDESGSLNSVTDVFDGLKQELAGREFSSLEEAQAFAGDFMQQSNQASADDFHGLSPDQMHCILNFPFNSPQVVTFPEQFDPLPNAPILDLFNLLVEAIGEQGLKPTAKGNLPQKFCRETALAYWDEDTYRQKTRYGNINKEVDFFELHVTRLVAELAGLIRKYKGRFILSRDCRRLLSKADLSAIYSRLFLAYTEEFNWGYWDQCQEIYFIQRSFLFSLYLLSRYGDDWRPSGFYEDNFLQAFPLVLDEAEDHPVFSPEQEVRMAYTLRTLEHFIGFLGLATVEQEEGAKPYLFDYRVKKLPLLDMAIRWRIPTGC